MDGLEKLGRGLWEYGKERGWIKWDVTYEEFCKMPSSFVKVAENKKEELKH